MTSGLINNLAEGVAIEMAAVVAGAVVSVVIGGWWYDWCDW